MINTPHFTRRRLLVGLAALTIAVGGIATVNGPVASGAEPTPIGQISGAAASAGVKPAVRTGKGKVMFPMQTTPRCYVLSNYADARSGGRAHEGVDILATLGQQVYTPSAGTLTMKYVDGGTNSSLSGNAWGLEADDGNYYFFAHLSGFADGLAIGDKIARGQLIGYVGDTGNPGAGNYHLHFEIHPGGMKKAAVDPLTLLDVPAECKVW